MKFLVFLSTNGYILIIPILLWNMLFYRYLPKMYAPEHFDTNIPRFISVGETVFRMAIFAFPLFIRLNYSTPRGRTGMWLFVAGTTIYFMSWIMLMKFPDTWWSRSIIGHTAPASTIIIWLTGFALTAEAWYFGVQYSPWHFLVPAIFMALFHTGHALTAYFRLYRSTR